MSHCFRPSSQMLVLQLRMQYGKAHDVKLQKHFICWRLWCTMNNPVGCACRVASSYATARHYAHQNHLVALAMFEWHSFARQQKAMRQHLRQAVKHYDGRKLQGQVFQHWKRWCNLEGRTNVGPYTLCICRSETYHQALCVCCRLPWLHAVFSCFLVPKTTVITCCHPAEQCICAITASPKPG